MLQLKNMSCGYGAVCAVSDLSLSVTSGSIFALIGANGAGKTSTIMSIAGHVNVQSGVIELHGENIVVGGLILDRFSEEKRMEYVFSLFPRLSERVKQLAGSLSGGEQQMLAIGRALMAEPKLLMIDEVSLGLMPSMIEVCYGAITKLKNEGMTILLVEQNTQQAIQVADDVAVLESGRMVWSGSGSEASKDPTLIEAYLGLK